MTDTKEADMNTHSKLRTAVLVLALFPLATVACDEGPLEVTTNTEIEKVADLEPRLVLQPNRVVLEPGQVFKLDAVLLEGRDEEGVREEYHPYDVDLEWNSSDMDVLIPLGEGLIQALAPGKVTVEADYRQWTARATVEVIHPRQPRIARDR
jgi:hypothetical protein